jgi:uncharacterized membrane protein SpoIIM required for sporulation
MELLNTLAAAAAAYVFGAIWYMSLSKPWMAATGIKESDLKDEDGKNKSGPMPFIIAFLSALVVAFMMQHLFALVGVVQVIDGLLLGLGIGLFIAAPWTATHYNFSMKPRNLIFIDAGYSSIGCAVIGLVLTLF